MGLKLRGALLQYNNHTTFFKIFWYVYQNKTTFYCVGPLFASIPYNSFTKQRCLCTLVCRVSKSRRRADIVCGTSLTSQEHFGPKSMLFCQICLFVANRAPLTGCFRVLNRVLQDFFLNFITPTI